MEFVTSFVADYGYLAIFLLLAPGTFGIPVPDELLLTFIGYLVLRGDLQLIPALAVVIAGAIIGITLDYWVGRAVGARLIREDGAYGSIKPDKFKRLEERLQRGGGWVFCLGYFLPGVRHWLAIAAGITRFPLTGFSRFAFTGALA
jgi:membrane protein DedA with SNARE-associated domain